MVKISLRIIIALLICSIAPTNSQAKSWRGITPLKSNRLDVEKLLGAPNSLGRYEFNGETAYIHYSDGKCKQSSSCECLETILKL